jgi:hypothetical protein
MWIIGRFTCKDGNLCCRWVLVWATLDWRQVERPKITRDIPLGESVDKDLGDTTVGVGRKLALGGLAGKGVQKIAVLPKWVGRASVITGIAGLVTIAGGYAEKVVGKTITYFSDPPPEPKAEVIQTWWEWQNRITWHYWNEEWQTFPCPDEGKIGAELVGHRATLTEKFRMFPETGRGGDGTSPTTFTKDDGYPSTVNELDPDLSDIMPSEERP